MITDLDKMRMREACEVAKQSNDTKCKVGAIVYGCTNKKQGMKIISSGFNGLTNSDMKTFVGTFEWTDDDVNLFIERINADNDLKRLLFFHAEQCLYVPSRNTDMTVIYISKFPCLQCAKDIVRWSVKRIVVAPIYSPSKWENQQREALDYLKANGVIVDHVAIEMRDGVPYLMEDLQGETR